MCWFCSLERYRYLTLFNQSSYGQLIDLDDLHDPQASPNITLEMQDRQRYFEGQMSNSVSADAAARRVGSLLWSPMLTIKFVT